MTRLYFENVSLRELAAFAQHLETGDRTLAVSTVNITNRRTDTPGYDVDIAVSCLVFAPLERQVLAPSP